MSTVETSEVTVLAVRCRRSSTGKPLVFMQVQAKPNAEIGYVRCTTEQPPLPGTRIKVTGPVVDTPQGRVMQMKNDKDIILVSGQQGILMRDTIVQMLTRMDVQFDPVKLDYTFLSTDTHLPNLDKETLVDLLTKSGVSNAAPLVESRENVFAAIFTRTFLDGCERVKIPFEVDNKRELLFKKDCWPQDILSGCMPNYIQLTHGLMAHKAMPDGKRLYLSDILKFDGVDNFFRAIAIESGQTGVYFSWINDVKRPAMITSCFIRDKQKEGIQIFTPDVLKQLERMGITNPEQIAARLGNMFQVKLPQQPQAIIPQGTYQSSSRIATLDKIASTFAPLAVEIDAKGLDSDQKAALEAYVSGVPVLLLAGPPGTGKSSLLSRFIQHTLKSPGEEIIVLTPVAKAASRLNQEFEQTMPSEARPIAATIHSMFFPGRTNAHPGFSTYALKAALDSSAVHSFPVRVDRIMQASTYKEGAKVLVKSSDSLHMEMLLPASLAGKTVIIDESSQVPSDLLALVIGLRPKRLVMSGDYKQLNPMGSGRPFHDLIELAKEGYLKDKLAFTELKTDHRATKELSAFTSELRKGAIPLDAVTAFDPSTDSAAELANAALSHGGSAIETNSMDGVSAVIDQIFNQILSREKPFYSFYENNEQMAGQDSQSSGFILPVSLAKQLSCQLTALPDTMVMASTNAEVGMLNQRIQSYLRPNIKRGELIQHLAPFAALVSNNLLPGDIIMQTDNAKTRLSYTTPQGRQVSSRTMNGESYLFLGANAWLPLPTNSNTSDVDYAVNNAWTGSTLADVVKDGIVKGLSADPNFHADIFNQISNLAGTGNPHALQLIKMSLSEVILVDQTRLRSLSSGDGELKMIPADYLKRLPILPVLPNRKPGAIVNDDSIMGLSRKVWCISEIAMFNGKAHSASKELDYPLYTRLYDSSHRALSTFMSGNAYTVHKGQGSQGKTAITVVSPPYSEEDSANHEQAAYTATTRAQEKSILLVHGKSVTQLNKIWADTRELRQGQESAVVAIAKGHLPPLCETLSMTTTYTPSSEIFSVVPGSREKSTMRAFRRRTALASLGLPSDIAFSGSSSRLKLLISNSTPNIGDSILSSDIPDSARVASKIMTTAALGHKRGMVWDATKTYSSVQEAVNKPTDEQLDAALNAILNDSSFSY